MIHYFESILFKDLIKPVNRFTNQFEWFIILIQFCSKAWSNQWIGSRISLNDSFFWFNSVQRLDQTSESVHESVWMIHYFESILFKGLIKPVNRFTNQFEWFIILSQFCSKTWSNQWIGSRISLNDSLFWVNSVQRLDQTSESVHESVWMIHSFESILFKDLIKPVNRFTNQFEWFIILIQFCSKTWSNQWIGSRISLNDSLFWFNSVQRLDQTSESVHESVWMIHYFDSILFKGLIKPVNRFTNQFEWFILLIQFCSKAWSNQWIGSRISLNDSLFWFNSVQRLDQTSESVHESVWMIHYFKSILFKGLIKPVNRFTNQFEWFVQSRSHAEL